MTNGGRCGTSGRWHFAFSPRLAAWLAFATVGFVYIAINAISVIDDRAQLGASVPIWEPWTWELTSYLGWIAIAPFVFAASTRFRPSEHGWPVSIVAHALMSVVASLAHIAIMFLLRTLVYALAGDHYRGDWLGAGTLLYEYRKDLGTFLILILIYQGLFLSIPASSAQRSGVNDEHRLEIRDGARTVWLAPADIDWAQAAGNYVELHGRFGMLLDRRTLAALEAELAPHGFVRIHRSRIVRAATIRSIETKPSGDFELALEGGERLVGSRRYRERLAGGVSSGADARG